MYGTSVHWQDRTGRHGTDHHWRLFQPAKVDYISEMHTDGFLIDRWARLPANEYLVHFEWVIRTAEQREAKLRRYDEQRPGYGAYFRNLYLPEAQPPGIIDYHPFGCTTFDALAEAYWSVRGAVPRAGGHRSLFRWPRKRLRMTPPQLGGLMERAFLLPRLDREVAAWPDLRDSPAPLD